MKAIGQFFITLILPLCPISAQDTQFLQFWNAPLNTNPALTGNIPEIKSPWRINNTQSAFNNSDFSTELAQQLSVDARISINKQDYIGVGMQGLLQQRFDAFQNTPNINQAQGLLSFSYIKGFIPPYKATLKHYLSLGLSFYYERRSFSSMLAPALICEGCNTDANGKTYFRHYNRWDADLGISWLANSPNQKQHYAVGVAVGHLNQSSYPFTFPSNYAGLFPALRVTAQASSKNAINQKNSFVTNFLYSYQLVFNELIGIIGPEFLISKKSPNTNLALLTGIRLFSDAKFFRTQYQNKNAWLFTLALQHKACKFLITHAYSLDNLHRTQAFMRNNVHIGFQYAPRLK